MAVTFNVNPSGLTEVFRDGQRVFTGTSQAATQFAQGPGGTLTAKAIEPAAQVKLPEPPTPKADSLGPVAGGQGALDSLTKAFGSFGTPTSEPQLGTQDEQNLPKLLEQFLGEPPSAEKAFQQAQQEAGITQAQEEVRQRQNAVRAAQAEAEAVRAEIQAVIDAGKARSLQLEKESERRGITTTILSRQQAEINRQSAIEVLPLQAKALAAQSKVSRLGGDLESSQTALKLAQDQLNTAYTLKIEDARNYYNYRKDLLNSIVAYTDKQESKELAAREKQETRNFSLLQDSINNAQDVSKTAVTSGDAELAAQIAQLDTPDIASETFTEDLKAYNDAVGALQGKIVKKTTNSLDVIAKGVASTLLADPTLKKSDFLSFVAGKYGFDSLALSGAVESEMLGLKKAKLDADVKTRPGEGQITTLQAFDRELKLATDFEKFAKESRTALNNISILESAFSEVKKGLKSGKPLGAQSQAVITAFNKLLDPTSVVRESEYARTPEGASLLNRLDGKILQITQGGAGLNEAELTSIYETAKALVQGYQNQQLGFAKRTQAQAEKLQEITGGEYGNLERVLTSDVVDLLEDAKSADKAEVRNVGGQQYKKVEGGWQRVSPESPETTSFNRPQRNNNPLNIKSSPFTQSFSGVQGVDPSPASDGGNFLVFKSPEAGFDAAKRLLTSNTYAPLTVDKAMRRWSGGGYGGEIVTSLRNKTIESLSDSELQKLIKAMARREGFTA